MRSPWFLGGRLLLVIFVALGVVPVFLVAASFDKAAPTAVAQGAVLTGAAVPAGASATTAASTTTASTVVSTSSTATTSSTTGPAGTAASTTTTRPVRTTSTTLPLFTKQHPLRVLEVGDSLATYPGYSLANLTKVYTGLQVKSVTKQSSGLVYPAFYNWPQVLTDAVAQFHPHVTVVVIGANDGQGMLHDGHAAALFSDEWLAEYANRLDRFISISTSAGASVIWVGLPIMRSSRFSQTERRLDELYRAACARNPGAVYIDGYTLFADGNGRYEDRLPDASGKPVLMRAGDGIHFTMDGADRIAQAVMNALLSKYRLERIATK